MCARLGEQITAVPAREAFLLQMTAVGTGSHGSARSASGRKAGGQLVARRAADRSREREVFFGLLAEAVPESARAKLLADLARLIGH